MYCTAFKSVGPITLTPQPPIPGRRSGYLVPLRPYLQSNVPSRVHRSTFSESFTSIRPPPFFRSPNPPCLRQPRYFTMTPFPPPFSPSSVTSCTSPHALSALSPGHSSFVFSCSAPAHKLLLHDTRTSSQVISLSCPAQSPSTIAVSPDGVKAAYGTATGAVYIWDVLYPSTMESFRPEEDAGSAVVALHWHPRGHVLAVVTDTGGLYLWDMVVGALLYPVAAHQGAIGGVCWTANGRLLVTVGKEDGKLRVWNPRNVECLAELSTEDSASADAAGGEGKWHSSGIGALDTLEDMSRVSITGDKEGTVLLSVLKPEAECGVFCRMPSHAAEVSAVRFASLTSPKPLRSASGDVKGVVQLFDMDRRLPMGKFRHEGAEEVRQLEFSSDGNVLFSAGGEVVKGWDARVSAEEEESVTFGSGVRVNGFCITDGGKGLVTAGADGKLYRYDVRYPGGIEVSDQDGKTEIRVELEGEKETDRTRRIVQNK